MKWKTIPRLARLAFSFLFSLFLVGSLILTPQGREINFFSYDYLFSKKDLSVTPENVLIVAIDEMSLSTIEHPWPWPRGLHAQLLDTLFAHGAEVVVFDILFDGPSQDAQQDQLFADAINRHKDVVLAFEYRDSDTTPGFLGSENDSVSYDLSFSNEPSSILSLAQGQGTTGFSNYVPDSDGVIRRTFFVGNDSRSLPFEAYFRFAGKLGLPLDQSISSSENRHISFLGDVNNVLKVSYSQVIDPESTIPKDEYKGKVVLVGYSLTSQVGLDGSETDHFPTPLSRFSGRAMSGVEIHANVIQNLIDRTFIGAYNEKSSAWFAIGLGTVFGYLFLSVAPLYGGILLAIVGGAIGIHSMYSFGAQDTFTYPMYPLLVLSLSYLVSPFIHYFNARKERSFIKNAFSTYMSPTLVKELIDNPDKLKLGGEEVEATVLFLDIAGFTSFSEKLPPSQLIEVINRCLGCFAETILACDGMIDKYIGDCIMAVWGVPIAQEDHAARACMAVCLLEERLPQIVEEELAKTDVRISIRMGLNSGLLVAGNVGGGKQFNYTVLGNEVNLAARLEGANKYFGTYSIVSEATKNAAGEDFVFKEIDKILVVGKKVPIKVFELVCRAEKLDKSRRDIIDLFEQGLGEYRKQNWNEAISLFESCLAIDPGDGPSKVFIKRCQEFRAAPPSSDWDGVYQMTSK
jgi:adenylate cyclase